MKVSIAVVKLFLRTSKKLSDGTSPIRLKCCWNGTKEVSTGYSCTPRYWDVKNECVKKGFPNYLNINANIRKMKKDAVDRRDEFERKGEAYTPEMVLKPKEVVVVADDDLHGMIGRYTAALSPTTCKTWKSFWNSFKDYIGKDKISVLNIDLETVKGYAKHLEDSGMKDSTIKMTLSKLAAVLKFAVEEGVIKESPFKRFNYNKKYKTTAKLLYVHRKSIEVLKDMLLERLIVRNGKRWHYNEELLDKQMVDYVDRRSDLFVLAFYLFGYVFQGLAPIDLCQLKVKDMKVIEKDKVKYYGWDLHRSKTKFTVKIRVSQSVLFNKVLVDTMLMFRKGEYLLPVLDGVENDHLKIYKKVSNWLSNHSDVLREWFKKANERIVQMNVDDKSLNIPLIDEKCSFYSYRDSYAMAYLSTKNSSPVALATLMGRSANTLASYICHLTSEDDLVEAVSVL